jgi:hypothetical protein
MDTILAVTAISVFTAAVCILQIRRALRGGDYRTRNDRRQAAWLVLCEPRPEPAAPGTNDALLAACNQLCPDLARKEERP